MSLRVKEHAEARGYSIRRLAFETNHAQTTIARYWHNYIKRPDLEVLKDIARILNMPNWRDLISNE